MRPLALARRRVAAVLAVVALGLTGITVASPAHAAPNDPPMCYRGPSETVYYKLTNVATGKSLNIAGRSPRPGAALIQWPYSGATNEQWRFVCVAHFSYKIVARHSGLVLDVPGRSTADGVRVQQYPYNGGQNQQWGVGRARSSDDGYMLFHLSNASSGKVLEVATNNLNIQQSTTMDIDRQLWKFDEVGVV